MHDVHGGINEEYVRRFNKTHGTSHTMFQTIEIHIHKYERHLRCSGGAWLRASGYAITPTIRRG